MSSVNDFELNTFNHSGNSTLAFFENQLLSYKQAAQYLGISEVYLRRLKSMGPTKGGVPYVQVGDRGIRFRISSLNKWIESREVKCKREN